MKEPDDNEEDEQRSEKPEEEEAQYEKVVEEAGVPNTKPALGDEVAVNYTSALPDGSPMDNTYKRQHGPYWFTIGANVATIGFERAVSSMNLQEKAKFVIPHTLLYGMAGIPENVPQESDIIFNIHLIQITKQNDYQEETDQVAVVEAETEVESEDLHESQVSEVFGIVAEMAMETAMNPPSPSVEEVETQQDEGTKTKEEVQNKGDNHAEDEVINIVGNTNLIAYNAEKAWHQASLRPTPLQASLLPTHLHHAPAQVFYNPQSFLAKGPQLKHKT